MAVEGKPRRRQRSSQGAWTIRALHDSQILRRLRADARGASAAEYAILLGLVGASLATAAVNLDGSISCSIDRSAAIVAGQDVSLGHQYGHSDPKGLAKGHRKQCN